MILWLSIFFISNFYQKHYDHCHIQKVFLRENRDNLGNETPKITVQGFKFGIYLSISIRIIALAKILEREESISLSNSYGQLLEYQSHAL